MNRNVAKILDGLETSVVQNWSQRVTGMRRRSDDRASVLQVHLNAGWRWLPYDRLNHNYVGEKDGYESWQAAAVVADALIP